MTLSRRSFLKVAGLTVVAAAGASMFTGCSFTTPIKYVTKDTALADIVDALNKKGHFLIPADAYKNADYMTGYLGSLIKDYSDKVEVDQYAYVEATDDAAAYLAVVLKAKAAA